MNSVWNKRIIIINGNGGVGKDTLIEGFSHKYKTDNYSSITPIKQIIELSKTVLLDSGIDLFDLSSITNKDEKARLLMSEMKQSYDKFCNLSTRYLIERAYNFLLSDSDYCFIHIREPKNIDLFKSAFRKILYERITTLNNFDVVYEINGQLVTPNIVRTVLVLRDTNVDWHNDSDNNVSNYAYDLYFFNNGDIKDCISKFIDSIMAVCNDAQFYEV